MQYFQTQQTYMTTEPMSMQDSSHSKNLMWHIADEVLLVSEL